LSKWAPLIADGATRVSTAKGIELGTLMRMSHHRAGDRVTDAGRGHLRADLASEIADASPPPPWSPAATPGRASAAGLLTADIPPVHQ